MNRKKWNKRLQRIRQRLSRGPRGRTITVRILWAVLGVVALALVGLLLVLQYLYEPPNYYEKHDGMSGSIRLWRDLIILVVAGLGLWIAGIRSFAFQKQAEVANKQQSSDQLSRGIELLATNDRENKPAIEARVGALYALEALAHANPKEYGTPVMKIMVSYIRNNAQRTAIRSEGQDTEQEQHESVAHLGEDTKTAFAALKRLHDNILHKCGLRDPSKELSFSHADFQHLRLDEVEWISCPNLSHANLSGSNLEGADLSKANLVGAQLSRAHLLRADLSRSNFMNADLSRANFIGAKLSRARFFGAALFYAHFGGIPSLGHTGDTPPSNVDFFFAQLSGAYFKGTSLWGANFAHAQLVGVNFEDAHLFGANFDEAQLSGAIFNEATQVECASFEGSKFDSLSEDEIKLLKYNMEKFSLSSKYKSMILEEAGKCAQIPLNAAASWKIWHSGQEFFTKVAIPSLNSSAAISKILESSLENLKKKERSVFLEAFVDNLVLRSAASSSERHEQYRQAFQALWKKGIVPQEVYNKWGSIIQRLAKNTDPP